MCFFLLVVVDSGLRECNYVLKLFDYYVENECLVMELATNGSLEHFLACHTKPLGIMMMTRVCMFAYCVCGVWCGACACVWCVITDMTSTVVVLW